MIFGKNNINIAKDSYNRGNTINGNIIIDKSNLKSQNAKKFNEKGEDKVFIIHGQSEIWKDLKILLDKLNIVSVELSQQPSGGNTIIEKFEEYAEQCSYAIAVFTFDDIVHKNNEKYLQVRPNVIFELGWFYAKLGRNRTLIVEEDNSDGNIFSDIQGIYQCRFKTSLKEIEEEIKSNLKNAGFLFE